MKPPRHLEIVQPPITTPYRRWALANNRPLPNPGKSARDCLDEVVAWCEGDGEIYERLHTAWAMRSDVLKSKESLCMPSVALHSGEDSSSLTVGLGKLPSDGRLVIGAWYSWYQGYEAWEAAGRPGDKLPALCRHRVLTKLVDDKAPAEVLLFVEAIIDLHAAVQIPPREHFNSALWQEGRQIAFAEVENSLKAIQLALVARTLPAWLTEKPQVTLDDAPSSAPEQPAAEPPAPEVPTP